MYFNWIFSAYICLWIIFNIDIDSERFQGSVRDLKHKDSRATCLNYIYETSELHDYFLILAYKLFRSRQTI